MARIIGKSEANCRQIFARARKRIAPEGQTIDSPPTPTRRAEGDELARRFFEATAGGDMDALLDMLAPDVVFHGDGGGKARAIGKAMTGLRRVAQLLIGGFRRNRKLGVVQSAWVNGRPGAVLSDTEGRVASVLELEIADGAIQAIRSISNPNKLTHIGPVSDVALLPEK
ncbi:nuclear transport factor 2 family protein [Streptomyces sp. NPDC088246]|uniref:nuclear transport factor 2 family protein n=1 Tax=Streptomyces sp. NPDC088246 TaxID=3365842 RepID=UPI0038119859